MLLSLKPSPTLHSFFVCIISLDFVICLISDKSINVLVSDDLEKHTQLGVCVPLFARTLMPARSRAKNSTNQGPSEMNAL